MKYARKLFFFFGLSSQKSLYRETRVPLLWPYPGEWQPWRGYGSLPLITQNKTQTNQPADLNQVWRVTAWPKPALLPPPSLEPRLGSGRGLSQEPHLSQGSQSPLQLGCNIHTLLCQL